MRFGRRIIAIAMALILSMLCSCAGGGGDGGGNPTPIDPTYINEKETVLGVEVSPREKTLIRLASRVYDDQQIAEITAFEGSIDELNAVYPIECLRKHHYGDYVYYRASYLGDGQVAVIEFDDSGNYLFGAVFTVWLPKSDFDGFWTGQPLEEVKAIDPYGDYSFRYASMTEYPEASLHCTTDGYLILIFYESGGSTYVLSGIDVELI